MRFEYKYLIPTSLHDQIKNEMQPFLNLSDYAKSRESKDYTVRSIYFDTINLKYYYEKVEGVKVRKKLRIRGYNERYGNSIVYLEMKSKNKNSTSKNRFPISYNNLASFLGYDNLDEYLESLDFTIDELEDVKRFIFHFVRDGVRPTMLVTYDREPYNYKFGQELRITFDKNLRYMPSTEINDLFTEENLIYPFRNKEIIEVKFNTTYPEWLRNILSKYDLLRMALSKYVICLENNKRNDVIMKHSRNHLPNYA